MKEIRMNKKILSVICAVLDHRKFIYSDAKANGTWHERFDIDKVNMEYYNNLPLPEGMRRNREDYISIIGYGYSIKLKEMCNTEPDELNKFLWKTVYE